MQLHFDDGHDTGVYAWKTLYELGRSQEQQWPAYLARRAQRQAAPPAYAERRVRLLFFAQLASDLRREAEDVTLPASITDVRNLVCWLRERGGAWERAFGVHALSIAINKQFATPSTMLKDGDEVALVPGMPAENGKSGLRRAAETA